MPEPSQMDELAERLRRELGQADVPPTLAWAVASRVRAEGRSRDRVALVPALGRIAAVIAIVAVIATLGSLLPARAPTTSSSEAAGSPSDRSSVNPSAEGPSVFPRRGTTQPVLGGFEFVRFLSEEVTAVTEAGGDVGAGLTNDEPLAAVLDRTRVDGMEWIRVQLGTANAHDFPVYGWVPRAADIQIGGQTIRVDPVYEPADIDCPENAPDIDGLARMLPAQILDCFGSAELIFSPVIIRSEISEERTMVTGQPEWLAISSDLATYGSEGWKGSGAIRAHVDPASGIDVPEEVWLAVRGRFDHPASETCSRSSDAPELAIRNSIEAVLWCRERFVISAVRELGPDERPLPTPIYGPGVSAGTVRVTTHSTSGAPISGRDGATGVWTGTELIIWGGDAFDASSVAGAAYDPVRDSWRTIEDGPLSPSYGYHGAWTGSEMLVWGRAHRGRDAEAGERWVSEGAAYDPRADRWRRIADAPLPGGGIVSAAWNGREWLLAELSHDDGPPATYVAVYDAVSDSWRSMPSLDIDGRVAFVAWAGTQAILAIESADGDTLFYGHLPEDAGWVDLGTPPGDQLGGSSAAWTGERLIVVCRQDQWFFLCALDPASRTWEVLPQPPGSFAGTSPVWTGDRFLFPHAGLAYEPQSGSWFTFEPPEGIVLADEVTVWAGDRLVIWGGNGGDGSPRLPNGFVVLPEW